MEGFCPFKMVIVTYNGLRPKIGKECFVAENATLSGDVTLEQGASVWFSSVLRAEVEPIWVGERSNVQDNCTLHTDLGFPVVIGEGVSIGHNAVIHGATIGSNCLIGMSVTLLNGVKVGKNCMVGAGALILQGASIPENSLVLGSPASVKREITGEEVERIRINAEHYSYFAREYLKITEKSKHAGSEEGPGGS